MDGAATLKAKVVSPYKVLNPRSNAENIPSSRPASPTKPFVTQNSNVDSSLAFRPKVKVNTSATTRKAALAKAAPSTSSTPRSRSPICVTPRLRSPPTHTKAPSYGGSASLRSPTIASAPVTPERISPLTATSIAASSSLSPSDDVGNSRIGTLSSLHHAVSFSSLQPTPNYSTSNKPGTASATSSPRPFAGLDREMTSSPTPTARIRSKVSSVAKVAEPSTPGLSPFSAHTSTRSQSLRTRTPSVSSTLSQQQSQPSNPSPQFYPITTASPAANPHRYASTRPPSRQMLPAAIQVFQTNATKTGPSAGDGSPPTQNRFVVKVDNIQAKADNSVPPLSPPMSAVSFSSRSSVSRSSPSFSAVEDRAGSQSTSAASSHLSPSATMRNGKVDLHATLDSLIEFSASLPSGTDSGGDLDDEIEDEEHKVKAAAKSNRKIADLEITNRSLLAINATLEATKHRQAKEIRELKRKLRESRLILPPRAYQEVKSSLDPAEIAAEEEGAEDEDQEAEEAEEDEKSDETYQRIRLLIDTLLSSGKRALEMQTIDFREGGKGGAKVLTAEEVRDWHQGTGSGNDHDHDNIHDEHPDQRDIVLEPQDDDVSLDEGDQSFTESELEVEALTLPPITSTPPIFITKPSLYYS